MSASTRLTEQIVERAAQRARGASVQALLRAVETSGVHFENDRLKSAESSQRTEIQVRMIVDGKAGVSTTTDMRDVDGVVSRALEAAQFGNPVHYKLPPAQPLAAAKTFDPAILPLTKPEMIQMGQGMMEMIRAYNPQILASADVEKNIASIEFANSAGATYSAEHTGFSVGTLGQLVRGTDILFAWHGVGGKQRHVDTEEIADKAIAYFRMAERIALVQTGPTPVIFTPAGSAALLLSLTLGLDGKNVLLGASPLRDKLGQSIANSSFTLIDDPLLGYGPNTMSFDDEGVPCRVTPLIEDGVLRNFIYDLDTAGRAGAQPTGHGTRRRYTNLVISPGDTPYAEMVRGIKQGLLVHGLLGLGQGNPINGEFSANVFLGYKIENGEIVGRVKDVMLAGNAYDALKDIVAISRERERMGGPFIWFPGLLPYIQVGTLSVVAK
jgi:PmbA protein